MKLFEDQYENQYGGFVGEAPKSSTWANMSAGSDTLGMERRPANI
jgi:hypothetical protein